MAEEEAKGKESGDAIDEVVKASDDETHRIRNSQENRSEGIAPSDDASTGNATGAPTEKTDGGQGGSRRLHHPSRNLSARAKGFGIGGGYERAYRKERPKPADTSSGMYGPLPPAGYYGTGISARPFVRGEAGFAGEIAWYRSQYGETTSGYEKRRK